MRCTVQYMDPTPPVNIDEIKQVEYDVYFTIYGSYSTCWHWWITSSGVWYVLYNTWILLHLLILMNYIKWSMICTVQCMGLTPPFIIDELQQVEYDMYCTIHGSYPQVDIDELQQVEYDMYCTTHGSYSTCWHWWNTTSGVWYVVYNTWILLHLLTLMNYNNWSMICTVQYIDLTPPVNIDELQQVEYDMYCTIRVSYSTCWHWWITTSGVWYVLYNTCIVIYLLTLMNYNKWSMICAAQYMYPTPPVDID